MDKYTFWALTTSFAESTRGRRDDESNDSEINIEVTRISRFNYEYYSTVNTDDLVDEKLQVMLESRYARSKKE